MWISRQIRHWCDRIRHRVPLTLLRSYRSVVVVEVHQRHGRQEEISKADTGLDVAGPNRPGYGTAQTAISSTTRNASMTPMTGQRSLPAPRQGRQRPQ